MFKKTSLWLILLLFLSFFSYKSIVKPGYFPMHDDMQAMRLLQLDKCIRDRQIPCRWVPDMGYGYGYPQFIYYSPLPYYAMEIFHLLGFQIIDSVKAGFILSFILSGLTMFILGRSLWGNLGGLISAVFYVYAPYRASDVYSRGAVGEFWALVFLPWIFWAILEFIRKEKFKYLIFLALSYGGLFITHNITSLAFTPVAALWGIFLLWYFKKWKLLPKLFLGGLWGAGLAGFFILPVVFEKRFAHVETLTYGYFNYLAHFVSLRQLFVSTHWGYGSSELGPYDDLSFAIGSFHWFFALLVLILVLKFWRKDKFLLWSTIFLFSLFLFSTFMTHQRSVFIWSRVPVLAYFQFPWRFLVLVIFAASALTGVMVFKIKSAKIAGLIGFLMIFGVIFLNANYFRPDKWYDITDKEKFSGESWEKQVTASIFDYLPVFAKAPPAQKAPDLPEIISGEGKIENFQKGTDWQKGKILVETEKAEIRLPLFYFPGFKVWVDQKSVPITYNNSLGLITFEVPGGEHEFLVKLTDTSIRQLGDFLTVLSFLAIGGWLAYEKVYSKT